MSLPHAPVSQRLSTATPTGSCAVNNHHLGAPLAPNPLTHPPFEGYILGSSLPKALSCACTNDPALGTRQSLALRRAHGDGHDVWVCTTLLAVPCPPTDGSVGSISAIMAAQTKKKRIKKSRISKAKQRQSTTPLCQARGMLPRQCLLHLLLPQPQHARPLPRWGPLSKSDIIVPKDPTIYDPGQTTFFQTRHI